MNTRYDQRAVDIVIEIDEYLKGLAPILDQHNRRCRMIRGAIEGQIEYDPPPNIEVLRLLSAALLKQAESLDADAEWLAQRLERLERHVLSRHPPSRW